MTAFIEPVMQYAHALAVAVLVGKVVLLSFVVAPILAKQFESVVDCNSHQPRVEFCVFPKIGEVFNNARQRFLNHFFRILATPYNPHCR